MEVLDADINCGKFMPNSKAFVYPTTAKKKKQEQKKAIEKLYP